MSSVQGHNVVAQWSVDDNWMILSNKKIACFPHAFHSLVQVSLIATASWDEHGCESLNYGISFSQQLWLKYHLNLFYKPKAA